MLNFITWTEFITATVILTAAYYAGVLAAPYGKGITDRLRSKRTGRAQGHAAHDPLSEVPISQIPEGPAEFLSHLRIYLAPHRGSRAEWCEFSPTVAELIGRSYALGEPLTRKQGGELLREEFLVHGLQPPDSSQLDELWDRYP